MDDLEKAKEKIKQLRKLLFFHASLTMDHSPLCTVKGEIGAACNCEVLITEKDPIWLETRKALFEE